MKTLPVRKDWGCLFWASYGSHHHLYLASTQGQGGEWDSMTKKRKGLECSVIGRCWQGEATEDCPEVGHLMWLVGHIDGFLWLILSCSRGHEYRDAGRTLTRFWQCWASCCRIVVWFPELVASEVVSQSSVVIQGQRGSHHRRSHVQVGKWRALPEPHSWCTLDLILRLLYLWG